MSILLLIWKILLYAMAFVGIAILIMATLIGLTYMVACFAVYIKDRR